MKFFENNYLQYANSDNFQSIANYIDGFKPTQRKIFYTYYFLSKKETLKVSQLASKMAEKTEYLSGENSATGVVINMAKNFKGTNNIAYFETKGHFGDRFYPKSNSAPRYIFIKENKIIEKIFRKEDYPILIEQEFEGKKIEPRFFIPILPMILINGSEGIGNGFSQKILPRNVKNVIEYIKKFLKNENPEKELLKPYFKNFKGKIKKEKEKVEIYPEIEIKEKLNYNIIILKDLPFNYDLQKILIKLEKEKENKNIINYKDFSENGEFHFEIKTKLNLNEFLKLNFIQKISENFTCIDEENKIIEFKNEFDLIEKYLEIRLKFYNKRKEYLLKQKNEEIEYLKDKKLFITSVLNNDLKIFKVPIEKIKENAEKLKIKFLEKHLSMKVYSFTKENIEDLEEKIKKLTNEIEELKRKTNKDLYLEDLKDLEKELL